MCTSLDQSVFPASVFPAHWCADYSKTYGFLAAVFQSLSPFSSRHCRSLIGYAAKTLFRVRLQYRQLRRLASNASTNLPLNSVSFKEYNVTAHYHLHTRDCHNHPSNFVTTNLAVCGKTDRNEGHNIQVDYRLHFRVVQKVNNAICRIKHHPADSVVCFVNTYPADSVSSTGHRYPVFGQVGPGL